MNSLQPPVRASDNEIESRLEILNFLKDNTIGDQELLLNLALFIEPRLMSRILFLNFLYQRIVNTQGVILDLGCRWGQNSVVFSTLRAIYEPYNHQRKVVAFDTFSGFAGSCSKDGMLDNADGQYSLPENYQTQLSSLLSAHEQLQPLNHIVKHSVIVGDVSQTIPEYICQHPETIVSLAYFDLDLYQPTVDAIKAIEPRLTVGSILAFDELNHDSAPGETLAVLDTLGLRNVAIQRFPFCSRVSYVEIK